MNSNLEKIIQYCLSNRVSTTEVSDALNKSGVIGNFLSNSEGTYKVGKIRTIFCANNSNYQLHNEIEKIEANEIALIFTDNFEDIAVFGELVSKYLLLYKRANAIVVTGRIRDYAAIRREKFAIWSFGATPLGCGNENNGFFPTEKAEALREKYDGGIAVCDDGGVTLIEKAKVNQETLESLSRVEKIEDLWFYCLDVLKLSTFDIVCKKAYLKLEDDIPKQFRIY